MRIILIITVLLLGPTAGVATGLAYKFMTGGRAVPLEDDHANSPKANDEKDTEFLKLSNQFLVPLVSNQYVEGLIALSISIELERGSKERVYTQEPKLRDAFLQVLFDHANMGGFVGQFTMSSNLETLKNALFDVARAISGDAVQAVLITDIARQDL
ncbi:flagellar basal body-associated FliL family protein [Rhodobacteraceae bacterium]|nr:flagellar basal body-associated FliL family protein [Paracoccaceae bacterium]